MFEENTINNLKLLVKASRMEEMKPELLLDPYGAKSQDVLEGEEGMKTSFPAQVTRPSLVKSCMVRLTLNLETDIIERLGWTKPLSS